VRPLSSFVGAAGYPRPLSIRYDAFTFYDEQADVQIALTLVIVSLAPVLGIIAYSAYSTSPTTARTTQPGTTILPIALFTSSLTLILLLPNMRPEALVVPLLPLSLMSCMRGGKDDLGDGAEWEWTLLLQSVVTY
jgi:hypothetical protein